MCIDLGNLDLYAKEYVAELLREAENDRPVCLAIGPGRPVRARLADWLYSVAARIEGAPRASVVRAEA
jgi:hypothetical protein